MTKLLDRVRAEYGNVDRRPSARMVRRKSFSQPPFWSLDSLRLPFLAGSLPGREAVENNFEGYVQGAYKSDGPVFACIVARMRVFSQARFLWCVDDDGQPGGLFDSPELLALRLRPAPNMTAVELLGMMEVDGSLAGNSYWTMADDAGNLGASAGGPSRRIVRMRPDWVWIIIESPSKDPYALDAKIVGFLYDPPM